MNVRGQVDLVDLQSMADGDYRYILNYQDHGMKDMYPVALKTKRVVEIAIALINIFKFIGPPLILHSDNGREFSNICLLYTSPSPRDGLLSRMPSSA